MIRETLVTVRRPTKISGLMSWLKSEDGIFSAIIVAGLVMVSLTAMQVVSIVDKTKDLQGFGLAIGITFALFFELASFVFAVLGKTFMSGLFAAFSVLLARATFAHSTNGQYFEDVHFWEFKSWSTEYQVSWVLSLAPPVFILSLSHVLAEKMEQRELAMRVLKRENPEQYKLLTGDSFYVDEAMYLNDGLKDPPPNEPQKPVSNDTNHKNLGLTDIWNLLLNNMKSKK